MLASRRILSPAAQTYARTMTQPSANPGKPLPPQIRATLETVVARVPGWLDSRPGIRAAPLEGVASLNNLNYRLTVEGADYVLRIAVDTATQHLGVRRDEEGAAAADLGTTRTRTRNGILASCHLVP